MSTMITPNQVHKPSNFDPMAYEFVDAFDNQAGDPGARGPLPAEKYIEHGVEVWAYSPVGASKQACVKLLELSPTSAYDKTRAEQCDHCGAHLRYVCVLRHLPTGNHIAVGETCLDNRVQSMDRATWVVKELREAAARARQAEKNREAREKFLADNPKVVEILARDDLEWCHAVNNVRWAIEKFGSAFDSKVERMIEIVEASDAKKAAKANEPVWTKIPVPEGRYAVEGVVLKAEWREGFMPGEQTKKIVVSCGREDNNETYAVWMTCPSSIIGVERGDRVRITATVTRSDRDESFGFGKRPAKAEIIGQAGLAILDSLDDPGDDL